EAYIDVTFDPRQPFVVETERMRVLTRGATFDVRDYREDATASVIVSEGSVLVRTPAAERSLGPGWRARVDDGGLRVDSVGVADAPAWLKGGLAFRDDSLGEVARRLTRWYGVPVDLAHPPLDSLRLTADFYGESASETSEEIADRLGLEVEIEGERILFVYPERR
ncbi:MAG: FecR domain-containing protein, partial [Rhodothermales bacterium]